MNLRKFLSNVAIAMAISTLFISSSATVLAASKSKTEKASLVSAATSTSGDTKENSGDTVKLVVPEEEKLIKENTSSSGDSEKKEEAVVSGDKNVEKVSSGDTTEVSGDATKEPAKTEVSGDATKEPAKAEVSGEVVASGDKKADKVSGDSKISGDTEVLPSGDVPAVSGDTVKPSGDNKLVKDIEESDWYFEYVLDAVDGKLMETVSGDKFNPNDETTEEDIAKALFNLNEQKVAKEAKAKEAKSTKTTKTTKTSSKAKKEEVKEVNALEWAIENKIIESKGKGNEKVSREQAAGYLYSYAKNIEDKELTKKEKKQEVKFKDKDKISEDYSEAMLWCNLNKIVIGRPDDTVGPKDLATRAETATMVVRLNELFK